jgi:hypothetical protein
MRRRPARPGGLTYFDANRGRLITEGPDILEIKKEILARWPGILEVFFDTESEEWVIVEKCKDGVERLAFTTKVLSSATIDKLNRIDQHKNDFDPNKQLEAEDRQAQKDKDHRFAESIGEGIERLYSALRKDGLIHRPQVFFKS